MMDRSKVINSVKRVMDLDVFKIENFSSICSEEEFEEAIASLTTLVNDFNEFLSKKLNSQNMVKDQAEVFAAALEEFFAAGYVSQDGLRSYEFAYDSNTQRAYDSTKEESLQGANKKEKGKMLAHTFIPLVVLNKKNKGVRRAICSGYAEIGCIIADLYGYDYTPLCSMVSDIQGKLSYDYAHYLFSITGADGNEHLVDLQGANTRFKKEFVPGDTRSTADIMAAVNEKLEKDHCRMTYLNPNCAEHEAFNSAKLVHGGLGSSMSQYMMQHKDSNTIVVVEHPEEEEAEYNETVRKSGKKVYTSLRECINEVVRSIKGGFHNSYTT